MATWILVPCLGQLRTELNRIAPGRDTSSDGTIGDTAHQSRSSDHNDDEVGEVPIRDADGKHEVHAVDLDADLRESDLTMEKVVQHIVARCRSGAEKRLRYVIYNRRIWEASNNWRQRSYNGDNPHDQHAHFSASYETRHEESTESWHLDELREDDDVIVRKGDSGEQVRFWQYMLADLGYDVGEIDGVYGPKMEAAVNAYRAKHAPSAPTATLITGWHAWHILRAVAQKHAGKPGATGPAGSPGPAGAKGDPGPAGPAGALTGTLTVTGGQLVVEAGERE